MAKLNYDLSEIPDITELEEGKFRARLVACTKGKSKASQAPLLTWTWLLLQGPNKGQQARSWTTLQDHALFGLKQHLLALGLKKAVNVDTDDLIGRKVLLVIASRPRTLDSGKTIDQMGVQALLPLSKGDDEEEPEAVAPKKKAAAEEDPDDDEEAPKPKKKKPAEDDEDDDTDDDDKPAKKPLKTVPAKKKAKSDDEDDDEPF